MLACERTQLGRCQSLNLCGAEQRAFVAVNEQTIRKFTAVKSTDLSAAQDHKVTCFKSTDLGAAQGRNLIGGQQPDIRCGQILDLARGQVRNLTGG